MEDGDLATAVFASMAIPGLIPPVERDGKYLIDGGLVNNVPVDLARALGADIVIVVNIAEDPKPTNKIDNFIEVLYQTQIILNKEKTQIQIDSLRSNDLLIEPSLTGFKLDSFEHAKEISRRGKIAARKVLPQLAALRLNDQQWLEHLLSRVKLKQQYSVIDEVRVTQNSKLTDKFLRAGISIKLGEPLDLSKLNHDIDRLYGSGVYNLITYRIESEDGWTVLHIDGKVKESSAGYFKFGVQLDSNLENTSSFKLGMSYTKPQINKWGGELRTEVTVGNTLEGITEFYQPIGAKQKFFVEPSLFLARDKFEYFDKLDRRRGDIKALNIGGSLQGGVLFGRWGELRGGVVRSKIKLSFTDKMLGLGSSKFDDNFLLVRATKDTLDSLHFPTKGNLVIAEYQVHDTFLDGDTKYNQSSLKTFKPFTVGHHTFGIGTQLHGATGRDANLIGTSNLGGFLSLSGFSEDEISGQYAAMLLGTYYYRLNRQAILFDFPLYIGGSLEAGNVYQSFDKIRLDNTIYASSIFAGVKSPLGPVFIGVGYNNKGNTSLYFSIGSFF